MKFFILKARSDMHQPAIKNWFDKIDSRDVTRERHHRISRITSIDVELNRESIFPDVISFPRFMVANKFATILQDYEPDLIFKFIALFDKQNRCSQMYAMPIIKEIACLSERSELNLNRSEIRRAVIERKQVEDRALFTIADVPNQYIVAELHLVESLLRRRMMGLSLQEVTLYGEGD